VPPRRSRERNLAHRERGREDPVERQRDP